jgi:hypothetical protein
MISFLAGATKGVLAGHASAMASQLMGGYFDLGEAVAAERTTVLQAMRLRELCADLVNDLIIHR